MMMKRRSNQPLLLYRNHTNNNNNNNNKQPASCQRRPLFPHSQQHRRLFSSVLPLAILLLVLVVLAHYTTRLFDISPDVYLQSLVVAPTPPQPQHNHTQQQQHVIFYNIFLPMDQGRAAMARALHIVEEHIAQIGTLIAAATDKDTKNTTTNTIIYYATIGLPGVLTPAYMNRLCQQQQHHHHYHLTCIPLGHSLSGWEEQSLEPLYNMCHSSSPNNNHHHPPPLKVTYLHSKGTFHSQNGENDRWRRHMTRAVLSETCLHPPPPPPPPSSPLSTDDAAAATCNVCGLVFYPLWTMFFPGNFWTADCAYVRQLVSPLHFRQQLAHAIETMQSDYYSRWQTNLYETGPGYLGLYRYSSEHWIASHPDVVPCDQSVRADLGYWWKKQQTEEEEEEALTLEWNMAPRHSITSTSPSFFRLRQSLLESIVTNKTSRTREYFLLTGFLHKWYSIYQRAPPRNSWIWKWFPHGSEWLDIVEQYGNASVEVLLNGK